MTLGKRTTVLIFPIVLAGYMLAALLVYYAQGKAVTALDQARMAQQLDHSEALFRADVAQSRSFLYSLLAGDAIRRFVAEPDPSYRNNALSLRLQQSIRTLSDDPAKFISFTIVNPDLSIGYYFENSDDPFAEIGPQQIGIARALLAGSRVRDWTYLHDGTTRPVIVYSEFIDPVTFARPLPSNKGRSLLVQVALQPDQFLRMRDALQKEYATDVALTRSPPKPVEASLSASVRLSPSLFLTLALPRDYVSQSMWQLKLVLGFGALAMSLVSIGLTTLLLRRFITGPIASLDRQVTAVMAGTRDRIIDAGNDGEIGRLTTNIKQLHDQSARSLRLVETGSWTDPLTGVPNRARFNTLANALVEHALAAGNRAALLFIDIDNFKFVNDKYGHEIGDNLLCALASQMTKAVAAVMTRRGLSPAVIARLSGDEFAVLIEMTPSPGTTQETCEAILALFDGGFTVNGKVYPVTASIGVAICPDDATNVAELISNADAAMYQAKTDGKNRSSRFSRALQDKRDRVRQIQEELRIVDQDAEFHLVYMPIVDRRGRVTGCEALLRWTSPTLGRVPPDEFVPIAESSGLFTKIDGWVIRKAMSDYRCLQGIFGPKTVLAINISSAELHSQEIGDTFSAVIEQYGLDPSLIEIELTETYAVKVGDRVHRNIQSLRAKGFRLSIDDFGAGYTSVQQLLEYPADTIKLDRAMVETMATDDMLPSLRAMIALCHARGTSVIAEGVDSPEKIAFLKAADCDLFQGYLICKPLALQDLGVWGLKSIAALADEEFGVFSTGARLRQRGGGGLI